MNELVLEISKLSVPDRIALIQEILLTISKEATKNDGLLSAQISELENRSISIQEQSVSSAPWNSIKEKLQARYGAAG